MWILIIDSRVAYTELFKNLNSRFLLIDMGCVFIESNIAKGDRVWEMDENELYESLDVFIDVVRTYFIASNIFLLRYHLPSYRVLADKYLKDEDINDPYKIEKLQFVCKIEDYFLKKVHCIDIPLLRAYFRKKVCGVDSHNLFESECYKDISEKIIRYINGNRPAINFMRPDFATSIKRYSSFYYDTICIKAFNSFLNWHILTELFVLSSTKETVDKYQVELVSIDKGLNWRRPEACFERAEKIKLNAKERELLYLLKALWCIENDRLDQIDRKYIKMLFRMGTVTDSTIKKLQIECPTIDNSIIPKDITKFNAGYYFANLTGDIEKASEYIDSKYLHKPVRMDVFGSCVSRVCLNERYSGNNNIVVPNLWWHVPPYKSINRAVHYSNDLFPEEMNYHMRNVKYQFDNVINDVITSSAGEWVIIDLYSLLSSNTFFYDGLVYTDFQRIISSTLKANRAAIWGENSYFKSIVELKESMEPWCQTILEKYGKNIILINCKLHNDFITDDDMIESFTEDVRQYETRNEVAQNVFEFLQTRLGCYTIDVTDSFLPDQLGYSGQAMIHYELDFYKVVSKKIWYIVRQKPDRKLYYTYSGRIRIQQLIRLMRKNSVERIRQHYCTLIDNLVLQMPLELVESSSDRLAGIYDNYWKESEKLSENSLRRIILEKCDLSENLELERWLCNDEEEYE